MPKVISQEVGWVVFDESNNQVTPPHYSQEDAMWDACGDYCGPSTLIKCGYTCRRVRVTIEEVEE